MTRKRTGFNILKEDSSSSTPNQPSAEDFIITTRKRRTKVQCFCSKCNGNLVDPRTKRAYDKKSTLAGSPIIPPHNSPIIPSEKTHHSPAITPEETQVSIESTIERHLTPIISNSDVDEEPMEPIIFIPRKKRVKTNTLRNIINIENDDSNDSNGNLASDIHSDEFSEYSDDDRNDDMNDNGKDDEFFNVFEDYSHPAFDFTEIPELPKNDRFTWILIWIMKFRSNYNLPNTATEALIKFVKILLKDLKDCENIDHESFPNSLYKAKKSLGLVDQFISFVVCKKCHKLYNEDETHTNCSHIEFPNSSTKRFKKCETPLAKQISLNNRIAFRPELIYPVASIR